MNFNISVGSVYLLLYLELQLLSYHFRKWSHLLIYYEDQNSPLQYTSLYYSWFLLQIYCKIYSFAFIFLLGVTTTILPSHSCIFRSFHAICCIAHKHMEDWLLLQICGYVYLLTYVVFILEDGMIQVKTKSNTAVYTFSVRQWGRWRGLIGPS